MIKVIKGSVNQIDIKNSYTKVFNITYSVVEYYRKPRTNVIDVIN